MVLVVLELEVPSSRVNVLGEYSTLLASFMRTLVRVGFCLPSEGYRVSNAGSIFMVVFFVFFSSPLLVVCVAESVIHHALHRVAVVNV